MTLRPRSLSILLALVTPCAAAHVVACSDTFGAASSGSGDSPDGGDGGVVTPGKNPPPGCDAGAEPDQNPCVVDNGVGIFASSSMGDDNADGTKEHPVKSLQKAIDVARAAGGKNVYACSETFTEALTLHSGVSVFGYFDCSALAWKVMPDKHALIQAASPAVTAIDITDPTVLVGFDIVAGDGTKDAPTSYGLFAKNALSLRIARTSIQAGKGFDGADGTEGTQLVDSSTKSGAPGLLEDICQLGTVACAANGGDCNDATCYKAHSSSTGGGTNACAGVPGHAAGAGGAGGAGGHWTRQQDSCGFFQITSFYDNGYKTYGVPADGTAGSGGATAGKARTQDHDLCTGFAALTNGGAGAGGAAGSDGASAAKAGGFSDKGFVPADGTTGTDGKPGEGGGGGGGSIPLNYTVYGTGALTWGIVGSGGGAGGCPGLTGTPGKGGGASVGVFSYGSALILDGVSVKAGNGGRGGKGTFGSDATAGGSGGFAPEPGPSGKPALGNSAGGAGGNGGRAGVSGAGAGGSSIAIAFHGTAPAQNNGTTAAPGTAGLGQQGRTHADGVRMIPQSPDGTAAPTLEF